MVRGYEYEAALSFPPEPGRDVLANEVQTLYLEAMLRRHSSLEEKDLLRRADDSVKRRKGLGDWSPVEW